MRWTGRGHQSARRARSAARDRVASTTYRYDRAVAENRAWNPAGATSASSTATSYGQRRVERLGEPRHRWAALGVEARDLPGRMDARIRPAGDGEAAPGRQHGVERLAHTPLDRPLARLPRPAAKPGPVVLQRQPQRRHAMLLTQVASARPHSPGRPERDAERTVVADSSRREGPHVERAECRVRDDLPDVHGAHVSVEGVTSSTRPSTATTVTSAPGGTSASARASQISPSSCTCPRGDKARTTTAVRPRGSRRRPSRPGASTSARRSDLDHVDRGGARDRDDAPRRRQDREREDHRDDREHGRRLLAPRRCPTSVGHLPLTVRPAARSRPARAAPSPRRHPGAGRA